jgi:hypothetical protein
MNRLFWLALALLPAPARGVEGQVYDCVVDQFHYQGPYYPAEPEFEQLNLDTKLRVSDEGDRLVVVENTPTFDPETRVYTTVSRIEDVTIGHILPPDRHTAGLWVLNISSFDEPDEPQNVMATQLYQTASVVYLQYLDCEHVTP